MTDKAASWVSHSASDFLPAAPAKARIIAPQGEKLDESTAGRIQSQLDALNLNDDKGWSYVVVPDDRWKGFPAGNAYTNQDGKTVYLRQSQIENLDDNGLKQMLKTQREGSNELANAPYSLARNQR
ncbi:MAG TPA: hypothetical protein VFW94_07810 [Candidatus Acidoferrales bacterium]|nr:hypothetical protein [Candidatus Acidoferrales bacterium]